jgi:hypothetical protein
MLEVLIILLLNVKSPNILTMVNARRCRRNQTNITASG